MAGQRRIITRNPIRRRKRCLYASDLPPDQTLDVDLRPSEFRNSPTSDFSFFFLPRNFRPLYHTAINIVSVCWTIFGAVWLIAAFSNKRSVYRETRLQRLRYIVFLLAGCYLLFRGHRLAYPLSARVRPEMDAVTLVAVILCIAGLLFCLWARATLGRNWSGTVTLKEGHELIVRGPYRLVRHPIYTGLFAMVVATAVVSGRLAGIIGTALVFISLWIKLIDEEQVMLKQFGDEYVAYQKGTKRIIPFVL